MTYVLIVMGYLYGYVHGPVTSFQEFSTAERCDIAAKQLTAAVKRSGNADVLNVLISCVER